MKHIIIIGGGFAGANSAKSLEKDFKVTLIDTKDYFEFTPSILRTLVSPEHLEKIQIPHEKYLKKTKIIKSEVIEVSKEKVILKNKKQLKFDYLIIASGAKYNMPFKNEDMIIATRAQELKNEHKNLQKSKEIGIIGGGAVGVELVAEIATKYKNKKINLIHSHERIMERNNLKASEYATKFLEKRGVELILNERAKESRKKTIITESGRKINCDLVFLSTGVKPNSEFMERNLSSYLDKRKSIMVNAFLQVDHFNNIFSAGDVNSINEEKTAQAAEKQSKMIVNNIINIEKNLPLLEYKPKKGPYITSLGKYNAILEVKGFTITGLFPALLKYIVELKTMLRYRS